MTISLRMFARDTDYEQMRRLLVTIYALAGPPVYASVGDLDWWCATDDHSNTIRSVPLWCTAYGDVVGFVWPSEDQVDMLVHPAYAHLEPEMLTWAERWRQTSAAQSDQPVALTGWSYTSDTPRVILFQQQGYKCTDTFICYRTQTLHDMPTVPPLPHGYTIRPMMEADLEQRIAAHQAAFRSRHLTAAKYTRVMQSPTYRSDLDLVVIAADTTIVAFCTIWLDMQNGVGVFEPVGCHPDHQRRGLTKIAMQQGLRRLYQLGVQRASVSGWYRNTAATRLYESLGFEAVDRNYAWKKRL